MSELVSFTQVSTEGLESSPVADALAGLRAEPFAAVNRVRVSTDAFSENGGDLTGLDVGKTTRNLTYTTLGLRLGGVMPVSEKVVITPRVSGAWLRGFGDIAGIGRHTLTTGEAFSIQGVPATRNMLQMEAGVDVNILPGGSLGVSYVGNVTDAWKDHGLRLGFSYGF